MPAVQQAKRWPLPKRFNVAITEEAYARLRAINADTGFGNNYILTILLENLDEIATPGALEAVFDRVKQEYGAPTAAKE